MLIEDLRMQRAFVIMLMVAGCTRPNPRDCSDGLCSDPAYPFCDQDGSLEGQAKACIAVSCTAGELRSCRGDAAVVCNDTGNNYDLVACERGCDTTHGCIACTSATDCGNPTPICDTDANACRACKLDDECPSAVCDQGTCLNEAGILYVLPNGSDSSDCSHGQPCSLYRAINLARGAAAPPIIRLLPGVYASMIDLATATSLPLRFVATGATMANQYAIKLQDGASADIRGLHAVGTSATVQCSGTTSARSQLTLRDAVITVGDGGANLVYIDTCAVTILGGELDIGSSTGVSVQMIGEPIVSMDRVHVHGASVSLIGASLAGRLGVKITNSLLENVSFNWATSDSGPPGSMVTMAFNTIVGQLNCRTNSGSAYRTSRYENNIVVARNSDPSVVDGTDCMLSNNILFPFVGSA